MNDGERTRDKDGLKTQSKMCRETQYQLIFVTTTDKFPHFINCVLIK